MTSPAPESSTPQAIRYNAEAAKYCECSDRYMICATKFCPRCGLGVCGYCELDGHKDAAGKQCDTAPASCSEVVERLANEAIDCTANDDTGELHFDRETATKILHEWREQIRKGANHD